MEESRDRTDIPGLQVEVLLSCLCLCQLTTALLQCRSCSNKHSLGHCKVETCQSNQMCYVGDIGHSYTRTHNAHCMSARTCRTLTHAILQSDVASLVGKKRYIHLCDVCCGSHLCNSKPCTEVKHDIYRLYQSNQLDMQTLSRKVSTAHSAGSNSDEVD